MNLQSILKLFAAQIYLVATKSISGYFSDSSSESDVEPQLEIYKNIWTKQPGLRRANFEV
jgi:hypothetical protein